MIFINREMHSVNSELDDYSQIMIQRLTEGGEERGFIAVDAADFIDDEKEEEKVVDQRARAISYSSLLSQLDSSRSNKQTRQEAVEPMLDCSLQSSIPYLANNCCSEIAKTESFLGAGEKHGGSWPTSVAEEKNSIVVGQQLLQSDS